MSGFVAPSGRRSPPKAVANYLETGRGKLSPGAGTIIHNVGGKSGNSFLKNLDRHLDGPIDLAPLYKRVKLL